MPQSQKKNRIKPFVFRHAQTLLPSRDRHDNKSHGGRCLVVAGSSGQWGAGILCARAAARTGAGYTYVFDPQSSFPIQNNPDFMTIRTLKRLTIFNSVAVGPSFQNPSMIRKIIIELAKYPKINVVLDAEALNFLARMKTKIKLPAHWVLTPHEIELSRLIKTPVKKIKANRQKYVRLAQTKWGAIIVLKGFNTLIADSENTWKINSGNPALAKAGTGDVLTGIIAGFLSQKITPSKAACLAAYTHGLIADRWVNSGNDHLSLLATDVIEGIPEALNYIRNKNS